MFSLKQAILFALVGSAYAVPMAHRHRDDAVAEHAGRNPGAQGYEIVTVTITETAVAVAATPAPVEASAITITFNGAVPTDVPSTPASSAASSSGSTGTDTGYMAIVNKYRTGGGLAAFTQSSKLEGNARKTAVDGNGQMVHELNPGSMGQVLAPGGPEDFEHVYVGGWLCEIPSLPGLNGICGSMSKGWSYDGQTGHAKILTNPGYSQIGCANAGGIWACDTA